MSKFFLKGKSFEVLDSIHDIRRQIARQNRAEREIIGEIKDIDDQNLDEFINTYSPKASIQEIVTQTDKAIEQFTNWFKQLRKIENIKTGTKESMDYAVELLDNLLEKETRDIVFPLIEDLPVEERVKRCRSLLKSIS